jgi:DNA-binding MurR/RpiR family transcriptional regulator
MKSLTLRIHEHLEALSPTDRSIADIILNFPGEIASYSANELAKMAGTSNAAVSRFVKRLGFQNYEEMRRLSRDKRADGSPMYRLEKNGVASISQQVERHVASSIANITDTFSDIEPELLSSAIEGIASARRVVFVGMRNGYFLAKYLRWQISEVRDHTELLPTSGETLAESIAGLNENDVVVVFAIRRIVPAILAVLDILASRKCRTLIIADRYLTQPVKATWLLTCSTGSQSPLDNHVAALLLCHIVADEIIRVLGAKGRTRLATIEDLHDLLGEM